MKEGNDARNRVTFLFDVDNTLLDNDRVAADLQSHHSSEIGAQGAQEYWGIFEQLQSKLGYADYLGALQRYRAKHPRAQQLLCMSDFLINYPFTERLFPDALKVIEHVQQGVLRSFSRTATSFSNRSKSIAQDWATRSPGVC